MTITLSTEQEKLINEQVKSGAYNSADEVISESLRLLKAKEEGIEALRREIMRGVVDIQEGRSTKLSADEDIDNFANEIIKRGQERLHQQDKQ